MKVKMYNFAAHFLKSFKLVIHNFNTILDKEETLDPANAADWQTMRQLGHKMVDEMFNYLQTTHERPVWQQITEGVKTEFRKPLPTQPQQPATIYEEFTNHILPFNKGNVSPRFWSWVEGGGTPLGMLADMLAAGMNPNVTIGDHSAMYVDLQVIEWSKEMFGFPKDATGMLLSGGSLANITGIMVARNAFEEKVRENGVQSMDKPLVLYTSTETHSCVQKAAEACGLGSNAVRKIPVGSDYRMRIDKLTEQIQRDRAAGFAPFCIVGNAGTVNTGAIDPLDEILAICKAENLWFHVDGAFGASAKLVEEYADALKAIEEADSLAFDFHKWFYVNYEVGCVLIKNPTLHRNAFAMVPNYLTAHERGLAGGPDPITHYGMELSRGFKALKVWMSLKEHGIEKYGRLIRQNIAQAFYLQDLVHNNPLLEMLAPVTMNIVCFRFKPDGMDNEDINALNREILMQLQERGIAAPSYTMLNGCYAIRCAITNHRSRKSDFDVLAKSVVEIGDELMVAYK